MLDLNFEIISPLTSQERYDIINNSIKAALDNGFLDSYVFEQAFWCRVAALLVDDVSDEIKDLIISNPIQAYDCMVKEEIFSELFNEYKEKTLKDEFGNPMSILDYYGNIAGQYLNDYKDYLLSLGGALAQTDMMSTDNLKDFQQSLQDFMSTDNTLRTLEVADSWGMNNTLGAEELKPREEEKTEDSLFN